MFISSAGRCHQVTEWHSQAERTPLSPPAPYFCTRKGTFWIHHSHLLHGFSATQVVVPGNSEYDDAQRKAQLCIFLHYLSQKWITATKYCGFFFSDIERTVYNKSISIINPIHTQWLLNPNELTREIQGKLGVLGSCPAPPGGNSSPANPSHSFIPLFPFAQPLPRVSFLT